MSSIKSIIGQRIASASVAFVHNHFGIRSFELEVRDADGRRLGTQIIPMDFLKGEGITYTLNGHKQVNNWANSKDGLEWLREHYGEDAKHIAQIKEKVLDESVRRKLPSLTVDEVLSFIAEGVNVFHNGGVRKRHVVGVGSMLAYKTSPTKQTTTAVWTREFAKWCKGVVLPDGTVLTKGADLDAWYRRDTDAGCTKSKDNEKHTEAAAL